MYAKSVIKAEENSLTSIEIGDISRARHFECATFQKQLQISTVVGFWFQTQTKMWILSFCFFAILMSVNSQKLRITRSLPALVSMTLVCRDHFKPNIQKISKVIVIQLVK